MMNLGSLFKKKKKILRKKKLTIEIIETNYDE